LLFKYESLLGKSEVENLSDTPDDQYRSCPVQSIRRIFFTWSRSERIALIILAALIAAYITFFSAFQIQRQNAYENSLDTLSIEQPLWNTLHGRFFRTTYYPVTGQTVTDFTNRKTESRLGDQVQLSLLALLIPYAILPKTETLLVIVCICVGLGAIPLYRIARRRRAPPWLALLFAAGYLFLPAIETNTGWDIHSANFLPPLLLAALDAAEAGHVKTWWVITLLAMGFREDFPIFVGWAMIWMAPKRLRKQAVVMFGFGLAFSLISFLVIIPYFGGGGTPYIVRFLPSGTPLTALGIWSAIRQGNFWWLELFKLAIYNVRLGLPFLFLYFASRPALLAMAPLIFANGLSWYPYNLTPELFHYSAPLISWAFVGAVDGFLRIEHYFKQHRPKVNWNGIFGVALTGSLLVSHWMQGYTPLSKGFVWPDLTGREKIAQELITMVPKDAAVSVEPHLAGHFSQFKTVYLFPDVRDAQWIMLDIWYGSFPIYLPPEKTQAVWDAIRDDPSWETVAARDGILLLKKGSGPPQKITQAYQGTTVAQPEFITRFGDDNAVDIVSISLVHHSKVEVTLCTDWELSKPQADMSIKIQFISRENVVSDPPADGFSLSPQIFSQPGRYRLCSRRMEASYFNGQRAILISLQSKLVSFTPVSIVDASTWAPYLKPQDGALEIDLSRYH
jgi:uncharacterized membrane protein